MTTMPNHRAEPGLKQRLGRFFYAEETPYGLAIVRILMPLVLLIPMLQRWPLARMLYSTDGAPAPLWVNYGRDGMLPLFSGTAVVALHTAMLFFLLAGSIGWMTRFSLAAATVLFTYINLCDSVSTITKYSVIASHVMLLLSLSNCGAVWSIDRWLINRSRRRTPWPGEPSGGHPRYPAWPRRLMQILIGVVYFGAAVTKMHTPAFFSGVQLQSWLLTNVNYDNPVGEYLSLFPAVLVFFAYITIVWETVFVFLCWRGWGRWCMVGLGAMFHTMTTLVLGLYVFPMVCITIYFAFVEERDVRRVAAGVRRLVRKAGWHRRRGTKPDGLPSGIRVPSALRLPAPALFVLAAAAAILLGVGIERRLDVYGMRRPEGPYAPKQVDPDLVATMLAPPRRQRLKDMFDTFEIGTEMVGGLLLDRRDQFRCGERVVVQASLNLPHHDMWLECNLHDTNDGLIDRVGQVVSREMNRANFYYNLSDVLEPGEYYFVLKSAGREITRRRVVLKPRVESPVAN